jgi:hypothetical protein
MAAPTVISNTGKAPTVGFATTAISNLVRENEERVETAEEEILADEANTTQAVVISDPGLEVSVSGTALSNFAAPAIGAALTAGDVAGYVTESRLSRTRTLARWSGRVKKEDSIDSIS